jgi:hypothetical protein
MLAAREAAAWGALQGVLDRRLPPDTVVDALRHVRTWLDIPISEGDLQDLADEGGSHRTRVAKRLAQLEADQEARLLLAARTHKPLELPRLGWSLTEALRETPPVIEYTVEDLHVAGGNTLIVAGFKTGKTTLGANLLRALVDREPFLGIFRTSLTEGRVAYFNYELPQAQFLSWMAAVGIERTDRIVPLSLRAQKLPFWMPRVRDELAAWLKANEVVGIVLDPVGRAWLPLVTNENDNSLVRQFTDAVDELKSASGVRDVWLMHHTGRAQQEVDTEHSRGATSLEDWMDAGWYLTKERNGTRMLRAEGRDVDVEATALRYTQDGRELSWTGQNRAERRRDEDMLKALAALRDLEAAGQPATSSGWRQAMQDLSNRARAAVVKAAQEQGLVSARRGAKNAQLHSLTKKGRTLLETREDES